jgi:spore coat polysaccharide biosynthesis protein SpsF
MGSERLPGRPSMPLVRAPLIVRQIERMARSRRVDRIVVSTTTDPADDALEAVVRREAIAVHRGPPQDELARWPGRCRPIRPTIWSGWATTARSSIPS